jgi:hypothetical protein
MILGSRVIDDDVVATNLSVCQEGNELGDLSQIELIVRGFTVASSESVMIKEVETR